MMRRRLGIGSAAAKETIQFEDFQPKSEWKEDDYLQPQSQQRARLLLLHLAEFKKEQLKVIYVPSNRTLRVTGERALPDSDTKRSRFNVTFAVPQNCDATRIQGKFQDGVLTVTMPLLLLPEIPTAAAAAAAAPPPSSPVPPHQAAVNEASPPPAGETTATPTNDAPDQKGPSAARETEEERINGKNTNDEITEKDDAPAARTVPPETKEASSMTSEALTRYSSKKRKESPEDHHDGSLSTKGLGDIIGERMNEATVAARKKAKGSGILERVDELLKDEDNRQTMANVGLAVIAVVAVGALVVYRYRSSFRDSA